MGGGDWEISFCRGFCEEVWPDGPSLYTDANGLRCARPWVRGLEIEIKPDGRGHLFEQVMKVHAGLEFEGMFEEVDMAYA